MTTKLTNEQIQTKSQTLMALASIWEYADENISTEVERAMDKLALELARDVNGLTL